VGGREGQQPYNNVGSHTFWKVLVSPGILCKIFRTWKVLENEFGHGKSWNVLSNIADGGRNDADADAKICVSAHLYCT